MVRRAINVSGKCVRKVLTALSAEPLITRHAQESSCEDQGADRRVDRLAAAAGSRGRFDTTFSYRSGEMVPGEDLEGTTRGADNQNHHDGEEQ
jgi:hypothetical protein